MAKSVTFLLSCFLSWILFCYIYLFISVIVLQYHRAALRHKCIVICHNEFSLGTVNKRTSFKSIVSGWDSSWAGETPEGKLCQGPDLGGCKHSQLALASIWGTGSWTLLGAAGYFSGYMGKGDRCSCLLAERQETDRKQKCFLFIVQTAPWTLVAVKQP